MLNSSFLHPHLLWLLLLIPVLLFWVYKNKNKQKIALTISSTEGFADKKTRLIKWQPILMVLRALSLCGLIIALARPQTIATQSKTKSTNGIDLVLATDVSGSMLSKDLQPNRLEALKKVAAHFISERVNDRIGLVVYAAEAYTKAPVTSDKNVLLNALRDLKYDQVIQDGTAIGVGLGTAINRLRDSQAKSKVVILMTDGMNNSGLIDPMLAAEMAKEYKIKVYTIGIGTNGMADSPYGFAPNGELIYKKMKVEIDEKLMESIAQTTGGKYFRATDTKKLEEIYHEINQLEKTKVDEQKLVQRNELFRPFALFALLLLLLEFVLKRTLFKGFI